MRWRFHATIKTAANVSEASDIWADRLRELGAEDVVWIFGDQRWGDANLGFTMEVDSGVDGLALAERVIGETVSGFEFSVDSGHIVSPR